MLNKFHRKPPQIALTPLANMGSVHNFWSTRATQRFRALTEITQTWAWIYAKRQNNRRLGKPQFKVGRWALNLFAVDGCKKKRLQPINNGMCDFKARRNEFNTHKSKRLFFLTFFSSEWNSRFKSCGHLRAGAGMLVGAINWLLPAHCENVRIEIWEKLESL